MNIKNISSLEAYELVRSNDNVIIVDVRTIEEWRKIGVPKLDKNKIFFISWRLLPDMSLNNQFEKQFMSNIAKNIHLLFICRSGARSFEVAKFVSTLGYKNCYNIFDGFEGNINGIGWRQNNLPWQNL